MIKKSIYLFGALILPLLVVWIFRMQYGYIYHAVDDVTINYSILNKEYMLLPYMGIVLTRILVIFQSLFSNVNVYFVFLVLAYSISFSCLLYLMRDRKYKIVLWIIVLVIEFALLKYFTYSVVAYLLSISGIFLLYKEKNIVFPIILIFIGISLRVQIIASLLVICLVIIIFELIRNKKVKQTGILISTIFIVSLTNWLFIQSNDVEKSYIEWNEKSICGKQYNSNGTGWNSSDFEPYLRRYTIKYGEPIYKDTSRGYDMIWCWSVGKDYILNLRYLVPNSLKPAAVLVYITKK